MTTTIGRVQKSLVVDTDEVVAASQAIAAIVLHSLAVVDPALTIRQMRILVMVSRADGLGVRHVAEGLGVNPSNASRACEELVSAKLLRREPDPADRRRVVLSLTPAGSRLVAKVMNRRRAELDAVVARMAEPAQRRLVTALKEFNRAAEEHSVLVPGHGNGVDVGPLVRAMH